MRFTNPTLLFAATTLLGSATAAVDASVLTELPTCAQAPLISGIANSGCDVTNTDCICGNASLMSSLQTAVKSACSSEDQEKTLELTAQICPAVSAVTTSASAETTPRTPKDSGTTSVAAATSIVTDTSAATTAGLRGTSMGTVTANLTATTGTYTAPTEPSVTPSTGAAAAGLGAGWVVLGMVGMGGVFVGL